MSDLVSQLKLPGVILAVVMIVWNTAHYAGPRDSENYLPPASDLKRRLADREQRRAPASAVLRDGSGSLELAG